jgi:hypothetical protein
VAERAQAASERAWAELLELTGWTIHTVPSGLVAETTGGRRRVFGRDAVDLAFNLRQSRVLPRPGVGAGEVRDDGGRRNGSPGIPSVGPGAPHREPS